MRTRSRLLITTGWRLGCLPVPYSDGSRSGASLIREAFSRPWPRGLLARGFFALPWPAP